MLRGGHRNDARLERDGVIYEIRVYEAVEGKANAMRSRFKNEVIPRMPRHGIELVGAFVSPIEDGKLTYLTRFANEEARQKSWASFGADPEWKALVAETEKDGRLWTKLDRVWMKPTDYSLLK